jgi:hypothetical protein
MQQIFAGVRGQTFVFMMLNWTYESGFACGAGSGDVSTSPLDRFRNRAPSE